MSDLIRRVSKLRPKPGDIIVIELEGQGNTPSREDIEDMNASLRERFPEHKTLIINRGVAGILRQVG